MSKREQEAAVRRSGNWLLGLGFLLALFVAVTNSDAQTVTQSKDVNVVNTPSVNVANTPGVSVLNGSGNPVLTRSVDEPARRAFHAEVVLIVPSGLESAVQTFSIPTGKRLVIEYVTLFSILPSGQTWTDLLVGTAIDGTTVTHHFGPLQSTAAGRFASDKAVRLYHDSTHPFVFAGGRSSTAGEARIDLTVSGYLVDLP
jgi:hypothetical protein